MKKNNKRTKLSTKLYFIISLIIFFVFFLLHVYNKKINPKIILVSKEKLKAITTNYLSINMGYNVMRQIPYEDIIIINKNNNGEILYINYNLEKTYKSLEIITSKLKELMDTLQKGNIKSTYYDKNIISTKHGIMLQVPFFISSKNALLSNLGPTVMLKINVTNSILTNIKTKVTNYGMNNALLELYVTIKINEQLISPVEKENVDVSYDFLIAATVINGRVPEFYGGEINKNSIIYEEDY